MSSRRLQITLQPAVLKWARERARIDAEQLADKMQVKPERVLDWERDGKISIAQADRLAQRTYTALGLLYLTEPPKDLLPIPDFRARGNEQQPSVNLLDTIYLMQRRQAWMREELIGEGARPLNFIGSYEIDGDPLQVASAMRDALQLADDWAASVSTWSNALGHLRSRAEDAGVLVVFNGVVGNNTSRKLDPDEFQGFALVDEYAPLVFVNNADFKAAQMFTLAHELAHLFVGKTGVSSFEYLKFDSNTTERFCDQVAAEFLVPAEELRAFWATAEQASDPYQSVARQFKVSSLVAARRARDLGLIQPIAFFKFYEEYTDREWHSHAEHNVSNQQSQASGGNFWNTQKWRIGTRFGTAIFRAVKEGRLLYREAYNLTGLRGETFENMREKMGILPGT